jgi:uncharacterized CHY-type Zn-finger protein
MLYMLHTIRYKVIQYFFGEEFEIMGTIVCGQCQETIEHYENEKVVVLYGTCPTCKSNANNH